MNFTLTKGGAIRAYHNLRWIINQAKRYPGVDEVHVYNVGVGRGVMVAYLGTKLYICMFASYDLAVLWVNNPRAVWRKQGIPTYTYDRQYNAV